jgi:hypothetical protein
MLIKRQHDFFSLSIFVVEKIIYLHLSDLQAKIGICSVFIPV